MSHDSWKDEAACLGFDPELFYDRYEEDESIRPQIEEFCQDCPLMRHCFAVGVSTKQWGVWGGVYLENGKISREFGRHKSKADWAKTWTSLTMEKN